MYPTKCRSNPTLLSERSELGGLRELSFRLTKNSSTHVSYAFQTIELDADDLHCFVNNVLSKHVNDQNSPVFRNLRKQVRRLVRHAQHHQDGKLCDFQASPFCAPTFVGEIVLSLQSIIQYTPSLSANMTAQVHSIIGLLRLKNGYLKGAIKSFLRVLWILSRFTTTMGHPPEPPSTDDSSTAKEALLFLEMGITRHRLGLAYGRSGNFAQAMSLLEMAVQDYEQCQRAGPGECQPLVLSKCQKKLLEQAKDKLTAFTEARVLEQTYCLTRETVTPSGRRSPCRSPSKSVPNGRRSPRRSPTKPFPNCTTTTTTTNTGGGGENNTGRGRTSAVVTQWKRRSLAALAA